MRTLSYLGVNVVNQRTKLTDFFRLWLRLGICRLVLRPNVHIFDLSMGRWRQVGVKAGKGKKETVESSCMSYGGGRGRCGAGFALLHRGTTSGLSRLILHGGA